MWYTRKEHTVYSNEFLRLCYEINVNFYMQKSFKMAVAIEYKIRYNFKG